MPEHTLFRSNKFENSSDRDKAIEYDEKAPAVGPELCNADFDYVNVAV